MPFIRRYKRRILVALGLALMLPVLLLSLKLVKHRAYIWLPSYIADEWAGRYFDDPAPEHLILVLADHWEVGNGTQSVAQAEEWLARYRPIAERHLDSQGRMFRYTWFYPLDRFQPTILRKLAGMTYAGYGEIELHWHHKHNTAESFEKQLQAGLQKFSRAGALVHRGLDGYQFAFIHGNWSLDNSRGSSYCGISNEIDILARNGCYVDLTFPSNGLVSQPATINRIYYAIDDPDSKSYDTGTESQVGQSPDGLLMLEGPLALNFKNPMILFENGALDDSEGTGLSGRLGRPSSARDYFKSQRVGIWSDLGISVAGKPEWVFVKLHAHGVQHADILLEGMLDAALEAVETYCAKRGIRLHYVTAREAYNLVKAAEQNKVGPPNLYYDFVIPPPLNMDQDFSVPTPSNVTTR